MACFTVWDIGACGCASCPAVCIACPNGLPATVTITDVNGSWMATWSATYGYWATSMITGFGTSYYYEVGCHAANSMFINRYWGLSYSSSGFVSIVCGYVNWSGTLTLVSGTGPDPGAGTTTFSQVAGQCPAITCVTCGTAQMPYQLSITDTLGTYTATWNGTEWITPMLCASSHSPISFCTSGTAACDHGSPTSGQPLYYYVILCSSANHMTIDRYWYELQCSSPPYEYVPCGCGRGASVNGLSSSSLVAVTCGSIAWSGTLTQYGGNLSDPVGGTVSFTQ
jgi:hypothetical protein